jgi:hypothetical protein
MEFFVPHVGDGSTAQEAWEYYVRDLATGTRAVFSVTYEKDEAKYIATVGQPRKEYARKTGPRGGRLKDAGHRNHPRSTGTDVTAIADPGGPMLYVWSMPPYGVWGDPSYVGRSSITEIEYFDPPV